MKNGIRAMKKRQAEKEAAYRNSRFAQKMQKLYPYMNRYSLILHGIWAIAINFLIEAMSRHSVVAAISYSRVSTKAFLYNAFMIFVTFSIVYLCKLMLSRRVTPFNAQDLKTVSEGVSLFTNYFNVLELAGIAIILILLVLGLIHLFRTAGRFKGKINYVISIVLVGASFAGYGVLTDYVIQNRIVSTYFANIAFAYQDYGLPYCFAASIFNTGISEPNGYTKEKMMEISNNGEITKSTSDAKVLPNLRHCRPRRMPCRI